MADLYNLSAEIGVLGAVLYDNANIDNAVSSLRPEDFYAPMHQELYAEILKKRKAGEVADGATLFSWAQDHLEKRDGPQYLIDLMDKAAFGPEIKVYANLLIELHSRRRTVELLNIASSDVQGQKSPEEVIDGLEHSFREIQSYTGDKWRWSSSEQFDAQEILKPYDLSQCIPTGWNALDQKIVGWPRGLPSVIAARPSMGKSMVGVEAARRIAQTGLGVGYFSLEMTKNDLWLRMACGLAFNRRLYSGNYETAYYQSIKAGTASKEHRWDVEEALKGLRKLPIQIDDRAGLKPSEMRRWSRRLAKYYEKRGAELGAIVVDHLQRVRPEQDRRGNPVAEMTDISGELMEIAKDLNIAVIELSQLNRAVENRNDKRPQLSDLRESGAIEQDAQIVIGLHRPWYYLNRSSKAGEDLSDEQMREMHDSKWLLEMNILKNRAGECGDVSFTCVPGANAVVDLPKYDSMEVAAE